MKVIDRVKSKNPKEDFRVELKTEWPEPQKAARQIAGHANAARGEPILWLIGVNEDKGVTGASQKELANWFTAVQSEFDSVAPSVIDLNIPVDELIIVALYFDTDRAPYVIKNPLFGNEKGGPISFETPWREGTSTRSARRADLIKMLIPVISLPEVEILGGELILSTYKQANWYWKLNLETYITPHIGYPCILPFHQCEASLELPGVIQSTSFDTVRLIPPYKFKASTSKGYLDREPDSLTIAHTRSEAIIEGPGRLDVLAEKKSEFMDLVLDKSIAKVKISIRPSHSDVCNELRADLIWHIPDESQIGKWIIKIVT